MNVKISKRIEAVIERFYDGNVARAAHAMGVNRSTLTRYVLGAIEPTPQSLILLSKLHGLDLGWLQAGPGLEIKYDPTASSAVMTRPVTMAATSKVPNQNSPSFSGLFRQVMPFHNVADRYWFKINASIGDKQIAAGDYFLMRAVEPTPVTKNDIDQFFMLKRGDQVLFDVANSSDVKMGTMIRNFLKSTKLS